MKSMGSAPSLGFPALRASPAQRIRVAAGEAGEARAALDIAVDSGYLAARPAAWAALDRVLALTWPWVRP